MLIQGHLARPVEHSCLLQDLCSLDSLVELLNDFDVENLELAHATVLRFLRDEARRRTRPIEPRRQLAPLELPLHLMLPDALVCRLLGQIGESSELKRLRQLSLLRERQLNQFAHVFLAIVEALLEQILDLRLAKHWKQGKKRQKLSDEKSLNRSIGDYFGEFQIVS